MRYEIIELNGKYIPRRKKWFSDYQYLVGKEWYDFSIIDKFDYVNSIKEAKGRLLLYKQDFNVVA